MQPTDQEQFFLISLLNTLQYTRAGSEVVSLEYDIRSDDEKYVIVHFKQGKRTVNVSCCSNLAIMKAVIRAIE